MNASSSSDHRDGDRVAAITAAPPLVSMPIKYLPLRACSTSLLLRRGFTNSSEVMSSKRRGGLSNLASELGCSLPEAASVYREVSRCCRSLSNHNNNNHSSVVAATGTNTTTAASLLSSRHGRRRPRPVVTFCREVDAMLGGGVAAGEVTEIVGAPGTGKTQIAMQLCVDARLPAAHGGAEGRSLYVDTEGSFSPERCRAMAAAMIDHLRARPRTPPIPDDLTVESVLDGVRVYRVHDEATQTATLRSLRDELSSSSSSSSLPVRLIVVDSIAFHYRENTSDYAARSRSLVAAAALLADLAHDHDAAVVVTNHVTTKFDGDGAAARTAPALGESWAHAVTTRLLLSYDDGDDATSPRHGSRTRRCTLVKSPHRPAGAARYGIYGVGVRDHHHRARERPGEGEDHPAATADDLLFGGAPTPTPTFSPARTPVVNPYVSNRSSSNGGNDVPKRQRCG